MKGFILLISGPSGAGKSTLLKKLFDEFKEELYFSISSTTRKPREDEKNGIHYHFISYEEFQKDIDDGCFLEWAKVHGNFYGTSFKHTQNALNNGKIVIFDIDVQGFKIVKAKMQDNLVSVFVTTKSKDELKKRLIKRNTDTIIQLEKRLQNASNEMKELCEYDYLIINDKLEQSYEALRAILISHKCKIKGQNLEQIQNIWNKGG
ncbi:guanylate kinase [Campylobacter hepaticus]|uniref:Guanylate kinase n=1 Tax=Campylobacter hepaticus TaxID=1813019 RepID=A0A424YZ93_9BACT|nr:guanylate kinase [Campylobacter hepaticus]AXP08344.1 guanylate kinase [Campylobacter hepaticus]MCZ0772170.1 guanylate kinase [Campylobacter hepaticus]MCZ0773639.1 guanylate kinase [Campylobacter hepaticus]MCZ0774889.1 guanylate kinase [Campylobacter hepaticus]MDX2322769.1 guanylate kinase [Campylobacter hepaticus]